MDLLVTVQKQGSRGGTGDFKWSDVQSSSRREHYLGHSLMAPVGRWQNGKDLNWYAKKGSNDGDGEDPEAKAARERKAELRRVKEAEEDAMARALGLPVPDRANPNLQALGHRVEADNDTVEGENLMTKGVGYVASPSKGQPITGERIEEDAEAQDQELKYALKEYRRRHGSRDRHHRPRSRSRSRDRRHRYRDRSRERRHGGSHTGGSHRSRRHSRSPSRDRHRRGRVRRSRSRSPNFKQGNPRRNG